jgi:hypothetical protein
MNDEEDDLEKFIEETEKASPGFKKMVTKANEKRLRARFGNKFNDFVGVIAPELGKLAEEAKRNIWFRVTVNPDPSRTPKKKGHLKAIKGGKQ